MVVRDSIGLVEFRSIARGMKILDEMAKRADFLVLEAMPVCPGKYVVLIGGDLADVEFAMERGVELGADGIIGVVLIPDLHPGVIPAVTRDAATLLPVESVGIIETPTVAATIAAADAAAKEAEVSLLKIRLSHDLGGKGLTVLTGPQSAVEAAVARGEAVASQSGKGVETAIIEQPHPIMSAELFMTESRAQLYLGQ
ncbi:MAG: BMC domain-containing protein [Thermoleophilia bacterium]|nr:BMC domain-containing protein [Thermoleophilia bacterium]